MMIINNDLVLLEGLSDEQIETVSSTCTVLSTADGNTYIPLDQVELIDGLYEQKYLIREYKSALLKLQKDNDCQQSRDQVQLTHLMLPRDIQAVICLSNNFEVTEIIQ